EIHDSGVTAEGVPFVVLQRLQGETLGELLNARGRLSPALAVRIGREIAAALAAVHAAGFVHNNLHPTKVFLHEEDGAGADNFVTKLIGFNVARCSLDAEKISTTQ